MTRVAVIGLATATAIAIAVGAPAIARADPRARFAADGAVCDPAALRARVDALLGRDAFVGDGDVGAVELVVRVDLAHDGAAVRATIAIEAGGATEGRRALVAADCAALTESAALAIAMVLAQPRATGTADEQRLIAPVAPPAVDAERPVLELDAAAGPAPRIDGLAMYAGAAGGRASGDFQGRIVVGTELRRGRRSIGVDFALAAPDRTRVEAGRVVVTTGTFELAGCLHRGAIQGCAIAAGGWVRGRGEDLPVSMVATTPYAATGLRIGWELAVAEQIALRIQLDGRVPLTRNRFLVDDMAVWSTSPVEVWLGVGVVARIP